MTVLTLPSPPNRSRQMKTPMDRFSREQFGGEGTRRYRAFVGGSRNKHKSCSEMFSSAQPLGAFNLVVRADTQTAGSAHAGSDYSALAGAGVNMPIRH